MLLPLVQYLPKETTEAIFKLADSFIICTINKEGWIRCICVCTDGVSAVIFGMRGSSVFAVTFIVKHCCEEHASRS